jgi:molybdate transport system substrate-binding protein
MATGSCASCKEKVMGTKNVWTRAAIAILGALGLLLLSTACGSDNDGGSASTTGPTGATAEGLSGTITVMTPPPLKGFIEAATAAFEAANPGVSVEMNLGHVPTLLTQIDSGVAADVLLTPDAGTMGQASGKDMVDGSVVVVAKNPMALVVPAGNPGKVTGVDALGIESLRVGVCAKELPCGKLADQLAMTNSITLASDTLEPGGSPGVVTKASTGEIDVGLVFANDIKAGGDKVDSIEIPESSNVSSEVSVALLKVSTNDAAARAFIEFLTSDKGRELAITAGFVGV